MPGIGTWNPEKRVTLDAARIARLCGAVEALEAPSLGLSEAEVADDSAVMRVPADEWTEWAQSQPVEVIETLIRVLTVAEMKLPGWEAKARSPVIPLVAELKRRGAYRKELTAWIKQHTTNRFLPHGSLMDRL